MDNSKQVNNRVHTFQNIGKREYNQIFSVFGTLDENFPSLT